MCLFGVNIIVILAAFKAKGKLVNSGKWNAETEELSVLEPVLVE